ncbi:hypothetical protein ACFY84_25460 [Streptomyces sp. NPDC012438]|uniref:hypothetical protein n=1 Tax=Streptomyces sp. NPDC012438 TaxID=3364833 RepID=UPI0036E8A7B3
MWDFNPLAGVGPLRFGMNPREVSAALSGEYPDATDGSMDHPHSEHYRNLGVTALYEMNSGLVGLFVNGKKGPQVSLDDVELIARPPVELRQEIERYSANEGLTLKNNWSGDLELPEMGLSTGARRQGDALVTEALFMAQEFASDPYGSEPVIRWYDIRGESYGKRELGTRPDEERGRWNFEAWVGVGPLKFGMRPQEVAEALEEENPSDLHRAEINHFSRESRLEWEWYAGAGVTAHYDHSGRFLLAVTVNGAAGPHVGLEGIELIGAPPSTVEESVDSHIEENELTLMWNSNGEREVYELGIALGTCRAGNRAVSEVTFASRRWMDRP